MKKILSFIIFTLLVFSCGRSNHSLDSYFPESQGVWQKAGGVKYYTPDNLYDYINGEAELYHAYDFQKLATVMYLKDGKDDSTFVVDLYDMGTPLNAFGVYSNYRYPQYKFDQIGAEAVISDFGLRFLKDRFMVEIKADDTSESTQTDAKNLALAIADRIVGNAFFPEEVDLLSPFNQKEFTARYISEGMLNLDFLPGGLEASYEINGEELTGFVVFQPTSAKMNAQLQAIQTAYKKLGYHTFEVSEGDQFSIGVQTKYEGVVLVGAVKGFLVGVRDCESMGTSYILLEQLKSHLMVDGN